mmetsp:Transcript_81796/g.240132  ORF Transcript_81796/g.240132 Transcript_81796/m.240132 type:complete len:376 (-) Transcript_81796:63-1190(-)
MPLLESRCRQGTNDNALEVRERVARTRGLERRAQMLYGHLRDQICSAAPFPVSRVVAILQELSEMYEEHGHACGGIADAATASACAVLKHGDVQQALSRAAISLLARVAPRGGTPACEALMFLIDAESTTGNILQLAVETLGILAEDGSPEVVATATRLLMHKEGVVRAAAVNALSKVAQSGDQEVAERIQGRLRDSDAYVRRRALDAMLHFSTSHEIGSGKMLDLVLPLLEDEDLDVRQDATLSLGRVAGKGNEKVLNAVVSMLAESDPDVRWGAVCALPHVAEKGNRRAVRALLLQVDFAREPWLRRAALQSLGQLAHGRNRHAHAVARSALCSSDAGVREAATEALEQLGMDAESSQPAISCWLCSRSVAAH